jgi:thiol:disulfide interchange protein DsbD
MLISKHIPSALAAGLLITAALVCAGCSKQDSGPSDENPVVVGVEVSPSAAVPGSSVTLVWRFAMADDWHLYWMGRNDSGYPPRIDMKLPEGWVAGGLQWPAPERYVAPGDILDHVYFGELVLLQKVGAPSDAVTDQDLVIEADVQWLACRDMCVPGRASVEVKIPVRSRAETIPADPAAAAADLLPVDLPPGTLDTAWEGTTFHVSHGQARQLTFMPTEDCGQLVDLLSDGQGPRLALRFKPKGDTVGPVRGLIIIEEDGSPSGSYRVDFPAVALTATP